jgi:ribonucleoside-diphosphate reductase alpha chain
MIEGDSAKRKIWAKIIQKRFESGYPYIFFSDTVNKNAPSIYRKKNKKIHASNLCSEIALSTDANESFVCNLSSMNLLHYDEWKDTDAVETMIWFLDAVMTEFIDKSDNVLYMSAPRNFAINQRALGLGVLGWHSYLQSKNIAFESLKAKGLTNEIFSIMKDKCDKATQDLAKKFGEPPLLKGEGRRNVTTMAIAPTTSSSFILGQVSPSIEPLNSNYFVKDLAKGKFTYKNPYLKTVLEKHDKDNKATWQSILIKGGSVQHLDFLSQEEKDVFKTFGEISQKEIVIQAGIRQKYIDQAQSLNLMIHPKTSVKEVNQLLIYAWETGIKTLYYHRGTNPSQELSRNLLVCTSCEA